jgi:hypothetical protein
MIKDAKTPSLTKVLDIQNYQIYQITISSFVRKYKIVFSNHVCHLSTN